MTLIHIYLPDYSTLYNVGNKYEEYLFLPQLFIFATWIFRFGCESQKFTFISRKYCLSSLFTVLLTFCISFTIFFFFFFFLLYLTFLFCLILFFFILFFFVLFFFVLFFSYFIHFWFYFFRILFISDFILLSYFFWFYFFISLLS